MICPATSHRCLHTCVVSHGIQARCPRVLPSVGPESILDAAAQRVRDDEWDRTHGDTEAFGGTDEGSHLMAQTAASDLRRGAFRCPSNGAQCLKECASPSECATIITAGPEQTARADGFWWVKWAGKLHPEFPWCVREIKGGRWTVDSLAPADKTAWLWGPYLGTEPAPAEDWSDGLALTPTVSYNGLPLPQHAWDIFERYQSASPSGLPGALLLDDKPARFVLRRDGVAVEALNDSSWSLGAAEDVEPQASPEADGPDVGRMLAQAHERGGKEACALVRHLMGEHGVEQHDPESLNYEPSRLPALVTALWRLTGAEPDTEKHPFKGETVLRYGERPAPGEGFAAFEAEQPTGGGWSIVSRKVCSCPLIMKGSTARESIPGCPIHGWED